jgi:hypothetical protein
MEPIDAPVVQPDLELAGARLSPAPPEIEAESTAPPSVEGTPRVAPPPPRVPPSVIAGDTAEGS